MESTTLLLRLNENRNRQLDEIVDAAKRLGNITKAQFYFLAGAYGYYLNEAEDISSKSIDVTRVEFLSRPEYKNAKIIIDCIYRAKESESKDRNDKYKLFERYANAGVDELYKMYEKSSKDIEEFIECLELELKEALSVIDLQDYEDDNDKEGEIDNEQYDE